MSLLKVVGDLNLVPFYEHAASEFHSCFMLMAVAVQHSKNPKYQSNLQFFQFSMNSRRVFMLLVYIF